MSVSRIGVFPARALQQRRRLFDALSSAFAVEFAGREAGDDAGLDGAIGFGAREAGSDRPASDIPVLVVPERAEASPSRSASVQFSDRLEVDERLRGRAMLDGSAGELAPLGGEDHTVVLARGPQGPLWTLSRNEPSPVHQVASPVGDLRQGERLKDRLREGEFLSLAPVIHFLRGFASPGWERPPLRASIVFDDANLHASSYGFLRFPDLAAHAQRHGYHANIAMIPLDGWFARRSAVATIRDSSHRLSLIVHGNDHTRDELGRPRTPEEALPVVATALQRLRRFEQRTGVAVHRVMSPPHALISEPVMSALRRTGFESVCYWGPTDDSRHPIEGLLAADLHLGDGFPAFHRVDLIAPVDELVLRSFLDQPLLLSAHHSDLADGWDVVAAAVDTVNRLGPVQWLSVRDAGRVSFYARSGDGVLRLRPFTRRLRLPTNHPGSVLVEWPVGVDPAAGPDVASVAVRSPHSGEVVAGGELGQEIEVPSGPALDLELLTADEVDPDAVPRRPAGAWPVVRRCMTEGRDRLLPVVKPWRDRRAPQCQPAGRS